MGRENQSLLKEAFHPFPPAKPPEGPSPIPEGLAPGYYQDPTERMIAEIHQAILEVRQEVHELRLAVVEMNRRQKLIEGDGK